MSEVLEYAAFTTVPSGGNPAGVVLDAVGWDVGRMQAVAAELGHSETAFVVGVASSGTGSADDAAGGVGDGESLTVRFFTPETEVSFCGHATLATAIAWAERHGAGTRTFRVEAGEVSVTVLEEHGALVGELMTVPARSEPATPELVADVLLALRWGVEDLDPSWTPHLAYAGASHLVLVTASRGRLAALDYAYDELRGVMVRAGLTTLQLVHPTGPDAFASRNPGPSVGIHEDPATGAAAGALGAYLRVVDSRDDVREVEVVQGEDMGRRSVLRVTIDPADDRMRVAGTAVPLASLVEEPRDEASRNRGAPS
ncbi:PhzF family phenazine biosynthesis protein [Nocardioidaceae bacterium]|nr:PhzF family phenazine biosynthesis protein [Nocardioidaceae bacterium]